MTLEILPPPRIIASPTSCAAAQAIAGVVGKQRAAVLAHIIACGGFGSTDDETAVALKLDLHSAAPRRLELQRLGLVVASGRRRRTRAGRTATVWVRSVTSYMEGAP